VALLRAARVHYPEISNLNDLDQLAERWKPYRGWAARLLWLDLLGYDGNRAEDNPGARTADTQHIP
jgi:3-methyladenine DNA glycosylase/8-oxoguanine DNA glycosylase